MGLFCVVDETGSIEFSGRGRGRGESSPFPRIGGILHTRVLNLLAPVATETLHSLLNSTIQIQYIFKRFAAAEKDSGIDIT